MKLTENQKDVFYIALTVFLAVGLGIVVFLIVKHFRNKNCTPNCNGKNCGDDGCKGNCGGCTSGQTCGIDGNCTGGNACPQACTGQNTCGSNCKGDCGTCPSEQSCSQDGKCTGGNSCPQECNEINCGDGCTACSLDCPSGKKCTGGKCNDDPNPTCYGEGEDPFDGDAANKCKKNGCCSDLKICFNQKSNGYTCQQNNCTNTIKPKCSTLPDRCKNKDLCIPDTPVTDNKEVYFYDKNRYQIPYFTDGIVNGIGATDRAKKNLNDINTIANRLDATFATKEQLFAEWNNGLDTCNVGWVVDDSVVYLPIRTARDDPNTGCGSPDITSTFPPRIDEFTKNSTDPKWGVFLYGVKPTNLPDCNGGKITTDDGSEECVAYYAPGRFSKFPSPTGPTVAI